MIRSLDTELYGVPSVMKRQIKDKPIIARYVCPGLPLPDNYVDAPEVIVLRLTERRATIRAIAPLQLSSRILNSGETAVVSRFRLAPHYHMSIPFNVTSDAFENALDAALLINDWLRENEYDVDVYLNDVFKEGYSLAFVGDFDDNFEVEVRMRLP